jgi:hypothetical protein
MDKIARALAISIVIFATIVGFVVTSRIDQNTISVLSGAVIGIITAAPFAAILTIVLTRKRDNTVVTSYERQMRSSVPLPQNPPQYWVLPQQFAGMNNGSYGQQPQPALAGPSQWQMNADASANAYMMRPRRRFYVIGENGEPKMVDEEISEQEAANEAYGMGGGETGAAF